jgi:hypothetical protein
MIIRKFQLPNGKELFTPTIFLTYTNVEHGMGIKPWKIMNVPGLLFPLNFLYPLVENGSIQCSLRKFFGIDENTITFLDCNLRYMPHEKRFYRTIIHEKLKSLLRGPSLADIDIHRVKEIIILLEPDLTSIPYYAIKFTDSPSDVERTNNANVKLLRNFLEHFKECLPYCPIPVVQVDQRMNIENKIKEIINILDGVGSREHKFIAYGGHVHFPYRPLKQVRPDLINIIKIRKVLGNDYYLHVFGIGSYTLVPACVYLGANSVDSTLWSGKAGRKEVIVPNIGARSLRGRTDKRQFLSEDEAKISCDCPICEGKSMRDMKEIFLNDPIKGRLHNAWVQINDMNLIVKAIKQNNLLEICEKRLKVPSLFDVLRMKNSRMLNDFMV